MDSRAYLISARRQSLGLLLLVLAAVPALQLLQRDARLIKEARRTYATFLAAELFDVSAATPPGILAENESKQTTRARDSIEVRIEVGSSFLFRTSHASVSVVDKAGSSEWRVSFGEPSTLAKAIRAGAMVKRQALVKLASERGYKDSSADGAYAFLEEQARKAGVEIPWLRSEVPRSTAAGVLAAAVLVVLVTIRSRLSRVYADRDFARAEPWIILDGRLPAEQFLAWGWLLIIGLSPWLVFGIACRVWTDHRIFDGWIQSQTVSIAMVATLVIVVLVGWRQSGAIVSMLLDLRARRRPGPANTPSSVQER